MDIARPVAAARPRARLLPAVDRRTVVRALLVAGACSLPILCYAPFFTEPFTSDEGFYASVAQAMKHGAIPYRDAFDNKPPLIFAWYYAAFALFGENVWAPRLLVSLLLSGATFLMYLQVRLLFGHARGVVAAAIFGASFSLTILETNANTEFFMVPFLVAALLCFTLGRRTGSPWWYAASGASAGVAVMTKDTSVFALTFLVVYAAWAEVAPHGWRSLVSRRTAMSAGAVAAGALAAGLIITSPFLLTGTFPDMWSALVTYTLEYVGQRSAGEKLARMVISPLAFTALVGPWVLLTLTGVCAAMRDRERLHAGLLVGWLAAAWLGIVAAGRFYGHYYVSLFPALAPLMMIGIFFIIENWRSRIVRVLAMTYIPVSLVLPILANGNAYVQPTVDERHLAKYPASDTVAWELESPALAAWLRQNTAPDDFIYNLGFRSELYFYADRASPTRYLFDHPFLASEKYAQDALRDLQANPPLYVVDSSVYEYWLDPQGYSDPDEDHAPIDYDRPYGGQVITEWVRANYDYVTTMHHADIYRLKEAPTHGD